MLIRVCATAYAATVLALVAIGLDDDGGAATGAAEARAAGQLWAGEGAAEAARRDGDEWEVDVVRPDGSLIEVTIGDRLELRGLDSELGPGGARAPDELRGGARERATAIALSAVGTGRPLSVEREPGGVVEVNIDGPSGTVEVELESGRVVEVEGEDPEDE